MQTPEPLGVFFTFTGVISSNDKDDLVAFFIEKVPAKEGNRIVEKYVHDEDTDDDLFVFARLANPHHASACIVLTEAVKGKVKPTTSYAVTSEYVYGELTAKMFEWSVGQETEDEFVQLSEVFAYFAKPCRPYPLNISGHAYFTEYGWDIDGDISNGAAQNSALWVILRNHVFATREDGVVASFDWFG